MKHSAFSAIEMILAMVVVFALFMYFLPELKSYSKRPVDNRPTAQQQADQKIQDVTKLRQQAEEQNRKLLEQLKNTEY